MSKPVILLDQGEFVGLSGATSGDVLTWDGTAWVSSPNGNGTVTSVTAGAGLSGGTITTSGTISMPNVGTAGVYGSGSSVPVITADTQGRVSSVTPTAIAIAQSAVAALVTDLAGKVSTSTQVIAGTGMSGGGALSADVTLSLPNVGTQGAYGSASSVAVMTTDQQGRVTEATTTAIAIAQSQVAGLVTDLASKADRSVTATASTGLTGGGTLASNFSFALDTLGTAQTDRGSATRTVKISTDAYGRVSSLTEQDIAGLDAGVITTGQLALAQGGTGIDASVVTDGQILVGGTGTLALQGVSGDATLTSSGAMTVTRLQGNAVSATTLGAPDAGKALVWSGSEWQASTTAGGVTSLTGTANQVSVSASTGAVVLSLPSEIAMTSASTAVPLSITAGAASGAGAAGGSLRLTGGAATAGNGAGGAVTINAGARFGSGARGDVNIGAANTNGVVLGDSTVGTGVYFNTDIRFNNITAAIRPSTDNTVKLLPNTGNAVTLATRAVTIGLGTAVAVSGGESSGTTGTAGSLTLSGGAGTGTNTSGGNLVLRGGAKTGTGTLGAISVGTDSTQTAGVTIGASGIITTINGTATLATLNATEATITLAATTGAGALRLASTSLFTIQPATSTLFSGFDVGLIGGDNNYAASGGVGGAASVTGGAGTGLNGNGGNVYIEGGAKTGTGLVGIVRIGGTANTRDIQIGTTGNTTSIGGTLTLDNATVIPARNGGTGFSSYFKGDILYAAAAGSALSKLAVGANGSVLAVGAGVPVWRNPFTDLNFVTTSNTAQTIDGIKTFTKAPVLSSGLAVPLLGSGISGPEYVLYCNPDDYLSLPSARMAFQPSDSTSVVPRGFFIRGQTNDFGDGGSIYLDGGARFVGGVFTAPGSGSVLIGTQSNTINIEIGSLNVPTVIKGSLSMSTMKTIIASSSTSASAGLRIPHGADVLSATNGDIWTTGSGLFAYISGVVQQYAPLASPTFTGTVTLPLATDGYVKTTSGGVISSSATVAVADLSGAVSVANGGTNNALLSVVQGTVYYGNGSQLVGLAPGTSGEFLQTQGAGAAPQWAAGGGGGGGGTVTSVTAGAGLSGGTITTSGTISMPNVGTAGTYGLASSVPVFVTDAQGRVTSVTDTSIAIGAGAITSGTLALANGGTNANLTATAGGAVYGTGTALAVTAAGTSGQFLQSNGASAPTWADVTASAPYDLRGMFVGTPASSAIIDRFVADRAVTVSTTSTNHKFSAGGLPSAGSVVFTVQRTRTTLGVPATVTVFTATSSSTDTILNGYYPMTISAVTNGDLLADDVLEVVVQVGVVNASFATIVYTISAVA